VGWKVRQGGWRVLVRETSAHDAEAKQKACNIDGEGVLGSFIIGTIPLQSHSFPEFLMRIIEQASNSIFTLSTSPFSERQIKPKQL
jgi:hypothetical protein